LSLLSLSLPKPQTQRTCTGRKEKEREKARNFAGHRITARAANFEFGCLNANLAPKEFLRGEATPRKGFLRRLSFFLARSILSLIIDF
jgi:hypothetical protein